MNPNLPGLSPDFNYTPVSGQSAQMVPAGPGGAYPIAGGYQQPSGQVLGASTAPQTTNTTSSPKPSGQSAPAQPSFGVPQTEEDAYKNYGMSLAQYMQQHPGAQTGPSQDQINSQINDLYNSSNQYLDQAEQQVRSDFPTVQQDINNQFTTNQGQLDVTNKANLAQFGQQADQAAYTNQNALADSRRIYSDLRNGYQARFGGATSAGDAANEIANVEQQRQEGQTNRGYQQAQTTINNQRDQVQAQYQQSAQALKAQTDAALNQANRDFQNKLLTITQSRAQNEQAKGQAKLQALQDLRNQVFSINQQNTQFQQTLEAQKNQAALQLQNYQALAGQGVNVGAGALGGYNQTVNGINYGQGLTASGGATNSGQNYTGNIASGQPNFQKFPHDGYSY